MSMMIRSSTEIFDHIHTLLINNILIIESDRHKLLLNCNTFANYDKNNHSHRSPLKTMTLL